MEEASIIARASQFKRYHATLSLGIGDDCALFIPEPNHSYAWAVDTLVEDTHFLREMPAESVAWKSLAVNLSDLAAMNATPLACLLSLALPPDLDPAWLNQFFKGFQKCCDCYRVDLAGGDTVRQAKHINISVSILGKTTRAFTRQGAQAGDYLVLSGQNHGAAAQGLLDFQAHRRDSPWIRYQTTPIPRFDAANHLQQFSRAHVLDTSDSLVKSLRLLADLNGLGCEVYSEKIPAIVAVNNEHYLSTVLQGGEDFQLLAAIPAAEAHLLDTHLFTVIGALCAEKTQTLHHQDMSLDLTDLGEGFVHF